MASGSFTFTGKLLHHDRVTPLVDAPITVSAATIADTADAAVYTQGVELVTDADGTFSVGLLTETGLTYTVSSQSVPPLFAPATFTAPAAATTIDLSEVLA
jgi:hypothetical protein